MASYEIPGVVFLYRVACVFSESVTVDYEVGTTKKKELFYAGLFFFGIGQNCQSTAYQDDGARRQL